MSFTQTFALSHSRDWAPIIVPAIAPALGSVVAIIALGVEGLTRHGLEGRPLAGGGGSGSKGCSTFALRVSQPTERHLRDSEQTSHPCIWMSPIVGRHTMRRRRDETLKWFAASTPVLIAVITLLDHLLNHAH